MLTKWISNWHIGDSVFNLYPRTLNLLKQHGIIKCLSWSGHQRLIEVIHWPKPCDYFTQFIWCHQLSFLLIDQILIYTESYLSIFSSEARRITGHFCLCPFHCLFLSTIANKCGHISMKSHQNSCIKLTKVHFKGRMDFEGNGYNMEKNINTKLDLHVSWHAFVLDGQMAYFLFWMLELYLFHLRKLRKIWVSRFLSFYIFQNT